MHLPESPIHELRIRVRVLLTLVVAGLVLSGKAYASPEGDPGRVAPSTVELTPVALALNDVDSPYLGIREAAVASLRALGVSVKPAVRAAFRLGSERRRAVLSRVLAFGADLDDIRLLLDALTTAKDPATAAALRVALIEHAEDTAAIVAIVRAGVASPAPALVQLEDLLARARMEALFISRKSKSGGTGSYPGQYDVMRVDRKRALDLCVSMLADEDVHRPGVYPIGSFRFLRPPKTRISEEEVREMAANAVSELCEADDTGVIERLKTIHTDFVREIRSGNDRGQRVAQIIALDLDDIVLPTLVMLDAVSAREIDRRVDYHRMRDDFDEAAHLRMRMKDFEDAVSLFEMQTSRKGRMVISYYNLACAYSRWSADPSLSKRENRSKVHEAVNALAQSVVYGYADWPWMEEDRDLDAIRKEADYARIVEGLRRQYPPIVRTPSSGLAPPSSEPTPGPPRNPPPPLPPLPTPTK